MQKCFRLKDEQAAQVWPHGSAFELLLNCEDRRLFCRMGPHCQTDPHLCSRNIYLCQCRKFPFFSVFLKATLPQMPKGNCWECFEQCAISFADVNIISNNKARISAFVSLT